MAYLNVREKLIETRIAYVGAELAGKATNFDRLVAETREGRASSVERTPVDGGSLLSLDWHPSGAARFDDCDVVVRLQTTHGAVSAGALDRLLHDVDGVVLVLDADPAAQDRNRRSLAALRDVLDRDRDVDRPVPVVVQLNKSDLPDAVSSAELVSTLDVAHWPHVSAAASRGDGVCETLQRALEDVLEAMKRTRATSEAATPSSGTARAEGNPLLAALRQILRDTVAERVGELEKSLLQQVDARLGRIESGMASRLDRIEANVDARLAQAEVHVDSRLDQADTRLERETTRLRTDIANMARSFADLESKTESIVREVANQTVRATTQAIADRISEQEAAIGALSGTVDASLARAHHAWTQELGTALDTRSRADREHVTATSSVLRRGIDSIAADVKKTSGPGARADLGPLTEAVHKLDQKVESRTDVIVALLEPTVPIMTTLPNRIGDVQTAVKRALEESVGKRVQMVSESVEVLRAQSEQTAESVLRTETKSNEVREALGEIVEELKKPKKGWFS